MRPPASSGLPFPEGGLILRATRDVGGVCDRPQGKRSIRQNMAQMEIDAGTRLVGILGDPVGHSLSPVMQNAAFDALGMNWRYLAFHVSARGLATALRGASALGLVGLNITIPHKVAAVALVDELDPPAQQIGAINVVRIEGSRLLGFNTDAAGVLDALAIDGQTPVAGRTCVVIGAGGGGRAAAFGVALAGARRLIILNRTVSRARGLAQVVAQAAPRCEVEAVELVPEAIPRVLEEADVLVHASPVTMSAVPEAGSERPPWVEAVGRSMRSGMVVLDMVYAPTWTELLKLARAAGARPVSGLTMLVHQGAHSFELWTGRPAPRDAMRRAVGLAEHPNHLSRESTD